jgi:hypothetical protein
MMDPNRFPDFRPDCSHPKRFQFLAAQDQGIAQWCEDCGALCAGANKEWQWANRPAKVAAARRQRDWAINELKRGGEKVEACARTFNNYEAHLREARKQRDDAIEAEKKASHEARSLEIRLRTQERTVERLTKERDEALRQKIETSKRVDKPAPLPERLSANVLRARVDSLKCRLDFAQRIQESAQRHEHDLRQDEKDTIDNLIVRLVYNA